MYNSTLSLCVNPGPRAQAPQPSASTNRPYCRRQVLHASDSMIFLSLT